jgi:hypothetical protein
VPELLSYIELRIDAAPDRLGGWLLAGSQQFALMQQLGESLAGLARDCGVSQPTIANWLGVLEASYVVSLLPPHFRNHGKRLIKSPKLFFLDPLLVTTLTRQPSASVRCRAVTGRCPGRRFRPGWSSCWAAHPELHRLTGSAGFPAGSPSARLDAATAACGRPACGQPLDDD